MPDLQYLIDTICARFTDESLYDVIRTRLSYGPLVVIDLIPLIQSKDRSLDPDSAKRLAEAALQDLLREGSIRAEGEQYFSVK